MTWLLVVLMLAAAVLAVVAAVMWARVWRQRRQQRSLQQAHAQTEQNRIDYIHESVNVIAAAVLDRRCPLTEGCIRTAVLLDNLPLDCDIKHRLSVLFEVYNATRHIPTHSSWQALDRKTRRRFQQEMWVLERRNENAIMEAMAYIEGNPFGRGSGASIN